MHKRKHDNVGSYPSRYLDEGQVCAYLSISRSTIRRWMGDNRFPTPVQLGPRCVRWKLAEIESWEVSTT